jgi:hypothetical protein
MIILESVLYTEIKKKINISLLHPIFSFTYSLGLVYNYLNVEIETISVQFSLVWRLDDHVEMPHSNISGPYISNILHDIIRYWSSFGHIWRASRLNRCSCPSRRHNWMLHVRLDKIVISTNRFIPFNCFWIYYLLI